MSGPAAALWVRPPPTGPDETRVLSESGGRGAAGDSEIWVFESTEAALAGADALLALREGDAATPSRAAVAEGAPGAATEWARTVLAALASEGRIPLARVEGRPVTLASGDPDDALWQLVRKVGLRRAAGAYPPTWHGPVAGGGVRELRLETAGRSEALPVPDLPVRPSETRTAPAPDAPLPAEPSSLPEVPVARNGANRAWVAYAALVGLVVGLLLSRFWP